MSKNRPSGQKPIISLPVRGVYLPRKVAKPHVYLSHEQVHRLAAASSQQALLVSLLAHTGLRWAMWASPSSNT